MKNIKNYQYDTWAYALKVIKNNAPKGLYAQWKEKKPVGVMQWEGVMSFGVHCDNSYNWLDEDAENIVFQAIYFSQPDNSNLPGEQDCLVAISFHIAGDIRGNYTDYFLFPYEEIESLILPFDKELWKLMSGEVE